MELRDTYRWGTTMSAACMNNKEEGDKNRTLGTKMGNNERNIAVKRTERNPNAKRRRNNGRF